jgi:hypothetical protein
MENFEMNLADRCRFFVAASVSEWICRMFLHSLTLAATG